MYKSPSGKTFTPKQVKMYYSTGGFRPSIMKSYKVKDAIDRSAKVKTAKVRPVGSNF